MTIHVLVEGPSERTLLDVWSKRLLPGATVRVHPHQGKGKLPTDLSGAPETQRRGLLDQLPATLRAYAEVFKQNDSVVVMLDADDENPSALATKIGNAIKSIAPRLRVAVCLAVEETEAFYLGDLKAMKSAFPSADMRRARAYTPDEICGTWELFGDIIGDGGGNKVAWAAAIAPFLTTVAAKSRSPSFRKLIAALAHINAVPVAKMKRRHYRHPSRVKRPSGKR